jgi:hypothetical protein
MPMMVGMMVCAVVVVCAAEAHNLIRRFSREVFLYPTIAPGVNEMPDHFETIQTTGINIHSAASTPLMRSTPASNFSSEVA